MRIISGTFKNRKLKPLKAEGTRPSSERLRESLFNILQFSKEEKGAFLDLFAGTGAMGLEAISRGFQSATFVENNSLALKCLKANIESLNLSGLTQILSRPIFDALTLLEKKGAKFDVIYLDPPYEKECRRKGKIGFYSQLTLEALDEKGVPLLAEGGEVFVEEKKGASLNFEALTHLKLKDKRDYGNATLYCLAKPVA